MLAQESSLTLIGQLVILTGDPPPDSLVAPQQIILLQDMKGNSIARLIADPYTVSRLRGQRVMVIGQTVDTARVQSVGRDSLPLIDVVAIEPVFAVQSKQSSEVVTLETSSHPWVNILCKFSDVATTPFTPAQYQALFSSTYPGLDHYCIAIEDFNADAVIPRLKRQGLDPRRPAGTDRVYFHDPDGIEVQFSAVDHRA